MPQARYDQRVRVFVEVRGGPDDWQEARDRFGQQGWPVRAEHPAGQGPLAAAVDPDPESRVFHLEVRLFGIARGSDRGAAERVRKVARAARLEAYVLRAEHLSRDREVRTWWRVIDARRRRRARRSPWRRYTAGWELTLGRYDTGGIVTGTPRQALRLARSGQPTHPSDVGVRPLDGPGNTPARRWPEEEGARRAVHAVAWAAVPAVALLLAAHSVPASHWLWGALALVGVAGAVRAGWRLFPEGHAVGPVVVLAASAILTAFGLRHNDAYTPSDLLFTAFVVGVVIGLWLLVRQWTWGEWVAWAVPLGVTLLLSSFLAAGSVLHALYADALGLSSTDLDVPPMWRFLASLKLLSMLAYVLAVPAWWGVARHRHHSYATPGERANAVLHTLVFVALLALTTGLALDSAGTAAERTKVAAARGTRPPPYFGVEPSWTCLRTTTSPDSVPGEGPLVTRDRPYLLINVAGGTAVLWDQVTREPVRLPASKVWLVPAASGRATCA